MALRIKKKVEKKNIKKAIITILGLSSFEAVYNSEIDFLKLNNKHYYNMFDLLCHEIDDYDIVPIYTKEALEQQKDSFNKFDNKIKKYDESLINEKNTHNIFKQIDIILNKYDEVVVDVTNGLRHIPILMTIDLIMQNIKNTHKIKSILFGKMQKDSRIDEVNISEYEIVDLIDYLDLANLSFILTNFKDNYTISKHIKVRQNKYQNLIKQMNRFSSDIMSLSLENLLQNSSIELIKAIDELIIDKDIILHNELESLKVHLKNVFVKKTHRYETYYHIAMALSGNDEDKQRGYLVHSLALIFEAIGFYLKSSFENYNQELKDFIQHKEKEIKDSSYLDYYKLTDSCRSFLFFSKEENKNNFFSKEDREFIYNKINSTHNIGNLEIFAERVKKLRNNLLHANSGNIIDNSENNIQKILKDFNDLCIEKNILKIK